MIVILLMMKFKLSKLCISSQDYTCNSQTGLWSIVTTENPNGDPPQCQRELKHRICELFGSQ